MNTYSHSFFIGLHPHKMFLNFFMWDSYTMWDLYISYSIAMWDIYIYSGLKSQTFFKKISGLSGSTHMTQDSTH
jgi:hypothetical protein